MGCGDSAQRELKAKTSAGKLLKQYDLKELLGQGGFGVVHKATHKGTKEDYAVKMVDFTESTRDDISNEILILRLLQHPTVVKLHEVYKEKVFVCLVLEIYHGGDMIQGLMRYWKSSGMVPIQAGRLLTKQMLDSLAWMHSKECVHRDVKGDNFMMDLRDVSSLKNKVYLNDFGTACECAKDQRLTRKCGTPTFWSPEVHQGNYAHGFDVWSVGVVYYGLLTGKFPFGSKEEIENKKPTVPKRCPPDAEKLLFGLLDKVEAKRLTAAEAAEHYFFDALKDEDMDDEKQNLLRTEESKQAFIGEVKEFGADGGVQQRRAELVQRFVNANVQDESRKSQKRRQSVGFCLLQTPEEAQKDNKTFSVKDPYADRSMTYQWWTKDQAKELCEPFAKLPQMKDTNIHESEFGETTMQKLLEDHNISTKEFGQGKAKTFEEFVKDIRNGQSRLQLDASQHKCIVRVVDLVLLRLTFGEGPQRKYLVHRADKYPDGRVRWEINQAPGGPKQPHENAIHAANRLKEQIGLADCDIEFDFDATDFFEEKTDQSTSYPGVTTIYHKEIVSGVLKCEDRNVLERVSLSGTKGSYTAKDKTGYERTYSWLTGEQCYAMNIMTAPVHEGDDFSTLVYPPIGLKRDELDTYLKENKVDTSAWGIGMARSVADFSEELARGQATLEKTADGKVKRVVDIVVVELQRKDTGEILVEKEETVDDEKLELKRLPAIKRRVDEHQFLAVKRLITHHMKLDDNVVDINPTDVRLIEEETESTSYPGIQTVYRKRFVKAQLLQEKFI